MRPTCLARSPSVQGVNGRPKQVLTGEVLVPLGPSTVAVSRDTIAPTQLEYNILIPQIDIDNFSPYIRFLITEDQRIEMSQTSGLFMLSLKGSSGRSLFFLGQFQTGI